MDSVVSAGGVADRPRRSRVLATRDQRVVAALSVGQSDRVDRRQVQDVEAELGQPRDLLLDPLQAAPGPREQLIPGADPRAPAVDLEADRRRQGLVAIALLPALDGGEQLGAERHVVLGVLGHVRVAQRAPSVLDQPAVLGGGRALGGIAQQQRALGHLAGEVVLAAGDLALEFVAPGSEHVGPGVDRVLPGAEAVDLEAPAPADAAEVLVGPAHLGLAPVGVAGPPIADHRAQDVVAVAEDVGGHADGVADAAFGGEPAVVDGGLRELDHDPRNRLLGGGRDVRGLRSGSG